MIFLIQLNEKVSYKQIILVHTTNFNINDGRVLSELVLGGYPVWAGI